MPGKKRILIIDDEESFGWFLKLNLEERGPYEVRFEPRGEAGIRTAGEFKPDLVLLDIAMPGLDGYQTSAALRSKPNTKGVVVLFLTGKDLLPDKIAEHCDHIGQCDFINKPFTLDSLLKKISELIK